MLVGRPPPLRARKRALLSGNTESIGQASDVEIHAKEMLESRDRLNRILAKHTGQSVERLKQDTDRDRFMDGDEAVRYGLIDRVMEKR